MNRGKPLSFSVALLGPHEWQALNPPSATYADFLPGVDVDGPAPVMVLPANSGHALDALFRRLWGAADHPDADRYSALVGLHELGHVVERQLALKPPSWLGEFLATYIGYVYLMERRPDGAQFWDSTCAALQLRIRPAHITLDEMGSGVGVENYVWYQVSLQARVREVARAKGWGFIEQTRSLRSNGGADLLRELDFLLPGFSEWAARNHGYVPPK